jgi:hypothetical protein
VQRHVDGQRLVDGRGAARVASALTESLVRAVEDRHG